MGGTMVATQDSYGTFKPAQEGHSRRIMLGLIFGVALVAVGCIATVLVSAAGTETQELAFDKYGLPIRNKKVASSLDSDFAALSTNPNGWHKTEYKHHGFKPKESIHKAEKWSTPKTMKVHKKTWKDVLNGQVIVNGAVTSSHMNDHVCRAIPMRRLLRPRLL